MSQQQNSFGPTLSSMRDPRIASYLSIIPGLGQIYNLEPRKGILFFLVGLTNFVSIIVLLWSQQLLNILRAASQELNIAPNPEIADALASLHAGSPALSILFILFIAFTIYAMRDAHDRAMLVRKNEIYAPYVMHLSEATSGSYLFHAVLMITLVLFAFFFLLPSPPHVQVTDIEFLNTQVESKTIQKTNKVSDKNTEAMRDPATKRVAKNPTPQEGARSQPAQTPRAMQKPSAHEAPSQPATRPAQPSKPVTATSEPKPPMNTTPAKPAIHPLAPPVVPARDPSVPQPLQKTDTASLNKTVSPPVNALPALNKPASDPSKLLSSLKPASAPTTNGPSPEHIAIRSNGAPLLIASSNGVGTPNAPPAAISDIKTGGHTPNGGPVPRDIKGSNNSKSISGPSPTGSDRQSPFKEHGGMISPVVPGSGHKLGTDPTPNKGVPGVDNPVDIGVPKTGKFGQNQDKCREIDFSKYMIDLQRRIKRAWVPPKAPTSKRVVVQFCVSTHGELSNLRLVHSCGSIDSDQAALRAVSNAAPFAPLPAGSPPSVDIEFTFDYNVFRNSGSFVGM